ncbi:hypothetical protein SISNIDRAFT_395513, partial [Sistotremastrum niveocremeum HHB9708]
LAFESHHPIPVSITDYLQRIVQYCPNTPNVTFVAILAYFDLIIHRIGTQGMGHLQITPRNAHRLIITGISLATKFFSDTTYSHARLAKVGGLSCAALRDLEIHFLYLLDWDLKLS